MTVPVTVYLQAKGAELVPVMTVELTSPEAATGQLTHALIELAQLIGRVMPGELFPQG